MKLEKIYIKDDRILIQHDEDFVLGENEFVGFRYKYGKNPRIIGIVALSVPGEHSSILWRKLADAILRPVKTNFLFERIPFIGIPEKHLYGIPTGRREYSIKELPIHISPHKFPIPLVLFNNKELGIKMLAGEITLTIQNKAYYPIFSTEFMLEKIGTVYSKYTI